MEDRPVGRSSMFIQRSCSTVIWQAFMASRAVLWLAGVTPAQQAASTAIAHSGKMCIRDSNHVAQEAYDMRLLEQLGFDNTYAIGVPEALAEEYGLATISDLAPIADQLTFGAEQEFFTLEGSMKYNPFVEFYGLNFKEAVSVDPVSYTHLSPAGSSSASAFCGHWRLRPPSC